MHNNWSDLVVLATCSIPQVDGCSNPLPWDPLSCPSSEVRDESVVVLMAAMASVACKPVPQVIAEGDNELAGAVSYTNLSLGGVAAMAPATHTGRPLFAGTPRVKAM